MKSKLIKIGLGILLLLGIVAITFVFASALLDIVNLFK